MLKAIARWILREDTTKTLPPPREREQRAVEYLSRADLDAELKKFSERYEWELSEWYEKFSTLHARSAKAVQRASKNRGEEQLPSRAPNGAAPHPDAPPLSVLSFRKPWSV